MDKSNTILSAKDLSVGFTKRKSYVKILNDVNLNLKKGTLTALVGINGSGKSTLLRTLAGLQKPLSGTIMLQGKSMQELTELSIAKDISIVLTQEQISKNLSVQELVALGRQPYTNWIGALSTKDFSKVSKALEDTETTALKDKKCYELSDGQLQRVLIARALAQDTPIILLDEPLSHLDLHHKAALLKILSKLSRKHKKAIIYSTHDISFAIEVSDTMVILQHKTAIVNTPENLIEQGVFENIFPSQHITFNTIQKRFDLE